MDVTKPIFIVGTGRCGSTALHRLLGLHPQLMWLHKGQDGVSAPVADRGPVVVFGPVEPTGDGGTFRDVATGLRVLPEQVVHPLPEPGDDAVAVKPFRLAGIRQHDLGRFSLDRVQVHPPGTGVDVLQDLAALALVGERPGGRGQPVQPEDVRLGQRGQRGLLRDRVL